MAAAQFAKNLVANWQAAVGPDLLGVYLIGSLAHGGFSRRYSDVDMAVISENGLTAETIDRVRGDELLLGRIEVARSPEDDIGLGDRAPVDQHAQRHPPLVAGRGRLGCVEVAMRVEPQDGDATVPRRQPLLTMKARRALVNGSPPTNAS